MELMNNILGSTIGTVIFLAGTFGSLFALEKSKIKISPKKIVQKFLYGEIAEEIKSVREDVENISKEVKENEIDRIKHEILEFEKRLKNANYTFYERDFEHILQLYEKYHKMGGNSVVDIAMEFIKEEYKEWKKNN